MSADRNSAWSEDAKAKLAAAMGAKSTEPVEESDDVYAGVVRVIDAATGLQKDELSRESRIHDDLNIDSLSILDIAVRLEDKFGVRISETDVHDADTIGELVELVENHQER